MAKVASYKVKFNQEKNHEYNFKKQQALLKCKYFGGKAMLKGSIVEYENGSHTCQIGARGKGNVNPAMTSACSKWEQIKKRQKRR